MTETVSVTFGADLDFLTSKQVADILHLAPISIYRLIARQALPVYRTCRKILFRKKDVLEYLERSRTDSTGGNHYGSPQG